MNSIATTIFKVSVYIQFGKCSITVTIIFKASSLVKKQLVSLFSSKKYLSLTREVNLKIKEFNYGEKTVFRTIHTENDADMLVLWRRIIN